MKKKFSILILVFLILSSFTSNIFAASLGPQCYDLFDQIKAEWREKNLHYVDWIDHDDYGFEVGRDNLIKNQPSLRSKKNHFIVGVINDPSLIGKIKRGDIIISVGEVDTSTISDEDDYNFFAKLGKKEIVKFSRNGKEFELELRKLKKSIYLEEIKTSIANISNVNIKELTFTAKLIRTIEADHYSYDDKPGLGNIVLENLIYKDKEGKWDWNGCEYLDKEDKLIKDLRLPLPGDDVFIENTLAINKNLINSHIDIWPYSERIDDIGEYTKITNTVKGTYTIQNNFNLQTFPFDKQVLKITYASLSEINDYQMRNKYSSHRNVDNFIKNGKINGWDMLGYDLYNSIEKNERGEFISKANIEIQIERQHGYYIYKVIIPILLILMVCWSVVWVHPKELESRLTITIVCLLSLIAYNFVIDSELPKLEYLTVMDWIILISYFYATIPNFISVISFRLYKKNRALSNKIENYSKRYGASSYLLSILIIILINANLNPENSSTLISWMAGN
jgi:hypothetical protein